MSSKGERVLEISVDNDCAGFASLLSQCRKKARGGELRFCMESTGGYEFDLASYLCSQGEQVSVVNPAWIKAFGKSQGKRNKTDKADAKLIAEYASTFDLRPWHLKDQGLREIVQLTRQRVHLCEEFTRVSNWLEHRSHHCEFQVRQQLALRSVLDMQLTELENELSLRVRACEQIRVQVDALLKLAGVGPVFALVLICEMGDVLSYESAQQYAAQAGLNPCRRESGKFKGQTRISKAGNAWVRRAGWMGALVAMTSNKVVRELVERLAARGLVQKQLQTAALRKLVMLCYGILKALALGKTPFYPDGEPKRKTKFVFKPGKKRVQSRADSYEKPYVHVKKPRGRPRKTKDIPSDCLQSTQQCGRQSEGMSTMTT